MRDQEARDEPNRGGRVRFINSSSWEANKSGREGNIMSASRISESKIRNGRLTEM